MSISYEEEALQRSDHENIIVVIEEETKKSSFILKLVTQRLSNNLSKEASQRKIVVFLAPTKAAVALQSESLRTNITIDNIKYTTFANQKFNSARTNIEEANRIRTKIKSVNVIVVTPGLLHSVISSGIILVKDLDSIILDECQEAKGSSPMCTICLYIESCPVNERPRIVGITSGFTRTLKTTVQESIRSLEKTLQCKVLYENKSISIKDHQFHRIIRYQPRSDITSIEDYSKRSEPHFPRKSDTLCIDKDMKLILNHSYMRLYDSLDLFNIYQILFRKNIQPNTVSVVSRLNLPNIPSFTSNSSKISFRSSNHHFNEDNANNMKSLVYDIRYLLNIIDMSGVYVAFHAFSLLLHNHLNWSSIYSDRPKNKIMDSDMAMLDKYCNNLKYSIFSISQLIEIESLYCDCLFDLFICFSILLGTSTCEKAKNSLSLHRIALENKGLYSDAIITNDISIIVDMISKDLGTIKNIKIVAGLDSIIEKISECYLSDTKNRYTKVNFRQVIQGLVSGCSALIQSFDSSIAYNLVESCKLPQISYLTLEQFCSNFFNNSSKSENVSQSSISFDSITNKMLLLCQILTNNNSNNEIDISNKKRHLDDDNNDEGKYETIIYCDKNLLALAIKSFLIQIYGNRNNQMFTKNKKYDFDNFNLNIITFNKYYSVELNLFNHSIFVCNDSVKSKENYYDRVIHYDLPSHSDIYFHRNNSLKLYKFEDGNKVNVGGIITMLSNSIGSKSYDYYNKDEINWLLSNHYNKRELVDYFSSQDNNAFNNNCTNDTEILEKCYTIPYNGLTINASQAKSYLFQICEYMSAHFKYVMTPTYFIETFAPVINGNSRSVTSDYRRNINNNNRNNETHYRCSILLPPSVPSKERCFIGRNCKSKVVAETSAALDCIIKLLSNDEIVSFIQEYEAKRSMQAIDHVILSTQTKISAESLNQRESLYKSSLDDYVDFSIKTVPDSLLPCDENKKNENSFLLYFYCSKSKFYSDLDKETVQSCGMCSRQYQAIDEIGICFLTSLSTELCSNTAMSNDISKNLTIETAMAGRESLDIQIQYINNFQVSNDELYLMQRYHKAVLAWESEHVISDYNQWLNLEEYSLAYDICMRDKPKTPIEHKQWARSSNSCWYLLFPNPMLLLKCGYLEWSKQLKAFGNEAQLFIHNLLVQDYLKINDTMPSFKTPQCEPCNCCPNNNCNTVDKYVGYMVSRGRERLSIVVGDAPDNVADSGNQSDNDISDKSNDLVNQDVKNPPGADNINIENKIHYWNVMPLGSLATIIPLLERKLNLKTTHSSHHAKLYPSDRSNCVILGHSRLYFIGLIAPSIIWRIISYQLADEANNYLTRFLTKGYLIVKSDNTNSSLNTLIHEDSRNSVRTLEIPSIKLLLEALTPRRCNEHINFERLEFIGDTFLKYIMSMELYKQYPNKREGFLTDARKDLVSNVFLMNIASESGLIKYMRAIPLSTGRMGLLFRPSGMSEYSIKNGLSVWNEHIITLQTFRGPKPSVLYAMKLKEQEEKNQINYKSVNENETTKSNMEISNDNVANGVSKSVVQKISKDLNSLSIEEDKESKNEENPKVIERLHEDLSFDQLYPRKQFELATKVKDKTPADLIEAILGAFLVSGGMKSAIALVKGLGCWPSNDIIQTNLHGTMHTIPLNTLGTTCIEPPVIPNGFPDYLRQIAVAAVDSFSSTDINYDEQSNNENNENNDLTKQKSKKYDKINLFNFIDKKFNYRFKEIRLLEEAFTYNTLPNQFNNQRLEFLGDAILDLIIVIKACNDLSLTEGELSQYKNDCTNNDFLAIKSIELGLHNYMIVPSVINYSLLKDLETLDEMIHEMKSKLLNDPILLENAIDNINITVYKRVLQKKTELIKPLADVFESLIAAIFLDSEESIETTLKVINIMGF